MNDILEAISARIKAPYFGYALLSFIALNWRGIFLLMTTIGSPQARLNAFDGMTSQLTLIILPLIVGALVTLVAPWIRFTFAFISRKPFEYIDNLNLDSEHKKTIRRTQLERSRSNLFAGKEAELIERAKRDEEVSEIENENLKEKLKLELDDLRRQRDQMSADLYSSEKKVALSPTEREMLKAASKSKGGAISRNEYLSGRNIQIGLATFGADDSREFSKYDSALKSLISKELVQNIGQSGQLFELTHTGWQIADTL